MIRPGADLIAKCKTWSGLPVLNQGHSLIHRDLQLYKPQSFNLSAEIKPRLGK